MSARGLAAGTAGLLVAFLAGASQGEGWIAFPLSLGVIAFAGAAIAARAKGEAAGRTALLVVGVLLLIPAFNLHANRVGMGLFDLDHSFTEDAFQALLQRSAAVLRGSGPLLLGAGLSFALLAGRRSALVAGAALAAFGATLLGRLLLEQAAGALILGDATAAAHLAGLAQISGLLAIPGALLGSLAAPDAPALSRHKHAGRLLQVAAVTLCVVSATPPVEAMAATLPDPATDVGVVNTASGVGWPVHSLDGRLPLAPQLEALAHPRIRSGRWDCLGPGKRSWDHRMRATEGLALPADSPVSTLVAQVPTLLAHGIQRVVLTARGPSLLGALGRRLSWPGLPLLLDRPAAGLPRILLGRDGLAHSMPGEGEACLLLVDPALTVGALTLQGLALLRATCPAGLLLPATWDPELDGPLEEAGDCR